MANVEVVGQTSAMTQSFHHQEVKTERLERFDLKTPEGDLGDVEADFQSLVNEMAKDSSTSSFQSSKKSFSSSKVLQESTSSSKVTKQTFSSSSSMMKTSVNGGVEAPRLTHVPTAHPKEPPPPPPSSVPSDNGIVTAVLAQVIPDEGPTVTLRGGGESEVVIEQPMRVRDRIRKIEKQLSTEDIPTGPPEVIMPRGRSGSVKNLAEQFSQADESSQLPPPPSVNAAAFKNVRITTTPTKGTDTDTSKVVTGEFRGVKDIINTFSQHEETTSVKKVEGEFKSVKETASIFQEPIQPMTPPIRPPPAFLTDGEILGSGDMVEAVEPVAVLPPATLTRNPPPPAPPKAPATVIPPPEAVPVLEPEAAPVACPSPPRPEPPAPAPDPQPALEPEPTPIYDFAPAPEPTPAPTPPAAEPIIPTPEPAPAVPPRDAKPTAPPPVPWRKNREEKPAPPPPPEVEPAAPPAPEPEKTATPPPLEDEKPVTPPAPEAEKEVTPPPPEEEKEITPTPPEEEKEITPPLPEEEKAAPEPEKIETTPAPEAVKAEPVAAVIAISETDRVFEEALAEISKYSETLSQTSTESRSTSAETVVQQPIQYSAQVKCEVKSRVTTPEVPVVVQEQQQQQQQQQLQEVSSSQTTAIISSTRRSRSEMKTSSTSSSSSTLASAVTDTGSSSSKLSSSKIAIAKAVGKPPKFEPADVGPPPKFSLLRSASTGSMASSNTSAASMKHAGSDKDLPKFSVKKVKDGLTKNARVWSPGRPGDERDASGPSRIDLPDLPSFKDQPSIWSPGRAGSASPSLGRKEYRKITYEGTQRRPSQENVTAPSPEESFAWKDFAVDRVARSPTSTLPKVQNPTVTLLQKKREGQIPGKRPEYLKPDDTGPKYKPDDKLYVIKREYESEDEEGGRRFAVLGPKKVLGVGPTTSDGVPTTLKSGVKSEHQGEWYRRMFDSLHKVKDDDHIIIKYKVPRARYGGYMSEPEGYDSDVCSSRYATLDRRRQHHYEMDPMTTSLPRNTNRYVHQPGRIEDYIPGYSSLSEKELKKNPDADIKLESQSQEPPPVSVNHRLGSQKMSITHALKESGYESDSTLVFRKREDARRQVPDPRKTSQVYRQIQRGGDIPLTGLQKPNPPKPRESPYKYESGEVNIHYRTPVRLEQKEAIPEEELARRQEEHMKKVYENERRKKYLAELEDIERRRHTDNFTPLQKSPIPLNRYDDDSSLGTMRGTRTPDLKQVAKALYNFTAQNKRELTFNKGDVVFIRRQIDKNWYEGESRGSVGIFPCNYVEIVPYESIKTLTRKPTEGQARARFNFQAQTSMEMSLSKGELVVLTRRVDENWYEGRIGNRKGIFPVSYVDTLVEPGSDRPMTPSSSPMPRPALPAANLLYNGASSYSSPYSTLGRPESQNDSRPYTQSLTVNTQQEPVAYRALYNYKPQNDDELELLESDIVMVMEKCDDGWFVGTSRRTGLFGTFPGNYVERV